MPGNAVRIGVRRIFDSGSAANAVLVDQGITYDLQLTSGSLNSSTATFDLRRIGINGAALETDERSAFAVARQFLVPPLPSPMAIAPASQAATIREMSGIAASLRSAANRDTELANCEPPRWSS